MVTTRSRHIDIRFHFVRDTIQQQLMSINYCESKENVADILMKALLSPTHWTCINLLGMCTELKGSGVSTNYHTPA